MKNNVLKNDMNQEEKNIVEDLADFIDSYAPNTLNGDEQIYTFNNFNYGEFAAIIAKSLPILKNHLDNKNNSNNLFASNFFSSKFNGLALLRDLIVARSQNNKLSTSEQMALELINNLIFQYYENGTFSFYYISTTGDVYVELKDDLYNVIALTKIKKLGAEEFYDIYDNDENIIDAFTYSFSNMSDDEKKESIYNWLRKRKYVLIANMQQAFSFSFAKAKIIIYLFEKHGIIVKENKTNKYRVLLK